MTLLGAIGAGLMFWAAYISKIKFPRSKHWRDFMPVAVRVTIFALGLYLFIEGVR